MARKQYHQDLFDRIPGDKRKKILAAAAAEFAARGFEKANINIVADKAGISVGSLYKYFGSKERCFLAVLDSGMSQLESALDDIVSSGLPLLEKIESILRLIPRHSRENPGIVRLYHEITRETDSRVIREFGERFEGLSASVYRGFMAEAKKEGLLDADADEGLFAFCLDNLFMMLQFSFACGYYKKRLRIYVGEEKSRDESLIVSQTMKFIRNAALAAGRGHGAG